MKHKIRPVRCEDAAALCTIYNHYVLETVVSFETEVLSEACMQHRICQISEAYPFLVCEVDGKVLGYAYAHQWKERAAYRHTWELTIYLHPEYCGQGIGSLLLQVLLPLCRAAGCRALIACITKENTGSIAFHEAHGFCQVSCFPQVGCKFGRMLDVVDFYLPLTDWKKGQ